MPTLMRAYEDYRHFSCSFAGNRYFTKSRRVSVVKNQKLENRNRFGLQVDSVVQVFYYVFPPKVLT